MPNYRCMHDWTDDEYSHTHICGRDRGHRGPHACCVARPWGECGVTKS